MTQEDQKELVGRKAAGLVTKNMIVGIGSGSTVYYFVDELGKRNKEETLNVVGVPTSKQTEEWCREREIRVRENSKVPKIDLAVDGADEVDKQLNLIKGGGGALTQEKLVDYKADKFVVIVDEKKLVDILGNFGLPLEVKTEELDRVTLAIKNALGPKTIELRGGKDPFITDNGNYILDCKGLRIFKPERVEKILDNITGIVSNGIFTKDHVDEVWIGYDSEVRKLPGDIVV